jgi:hypothetical protein
VHCEERRCISEDARDWIAKLIDDDEEPDYESFVVLYCPDCAERSSSGSRAAGTPDDSADGGRSAVSFVGSSGSVESGRAARGGPRCRAS